jgi:uncharacterized OB-fold protein
MLSNRPPVVSPEALPYWEGADAGKLMMQWCLECGSLNWFPRAFCVKCSSVRLEWREASGRGSIHSLSVVHRAMDETYEDEVPYVLAVVELEEGALMVTQILGEDRLVSQIDAPVRVRFEPTGGHALPCFELVGEREY